MDKSLEDIIKTRFSGKKNQNGARKGILKKPKQGPIQKKRPFHQNKPHPAPVIQDARSIIARSKRAKVSDARVILAKKARRTQREQPPIRRNAPPQRKRREPISDIDEDMLDLDLTPPVLRRTVKNDIRPPPAMPPLPTFGRDRAAMSDPFDCYEPYERPAFIPKAPPAPIINLDEPYYPERSPRKGILRKNSPPPASAAIKSRLYAAPDPRQPSGLFARDRDPDKETANGYRIVVSNLHNTVTQTDIQELFEDIGELIEARLVRPGVAEVIYARLHDAEIAVETYHNRQLDGQPMKCLLVRPRPTTVLSATPAQRYINKNVELDLDTLHKVLFNR